MIQYILTDIEGTTTAISFVAEELFPYFSEHAPNFLHENIEDSFVQAQFSEVKKTILEEQQQNIDNQAVIEVLLHWTKIDRKHTALKALQGFLWKIGYQKGELQGHIYPEVPFYLEKWQKAGKKIGVYSSGSVEAQKLLFGTSIFGNLLPFFSHHFDTKIGQKKEIQSYQNIAETLVIAPDKILFLSDICAELEAAQGAGMHVFQLLREGSTPCENFAQGVNFEAVDSWLQELS